jgi:hypothetical protein
VLVDDVGRAGITTDSTGANVTGAGCAGITLVTETTVAVALLELDRAASSDSDHPMFALPNIAIKLNENTAAMDGCFTTITPLVCRKRPNSRVEVSSLAWKNGSSRI